MDAKIEHDKELAHELFHFFKEKTWELTETWYKLLDKSDPTGIYSSQDPNVIKDVKEQNYEFHLQFCDVFIREEQPFYTDFEKWIVAIASDEQHLTTPVHYILREFFRTQEQYLDLFEEFISLKDKEYSIDKINKWRRRIIFTFEKIVSWFVEENNKFSMARLEAQQETIKELSTPVIQVGNEKALLPLIGDIDEVRSKMILENTLQSVAKKRIELLYIDLSGVLIMDTMVAHQIFQLIKSLDLLGVKSILSGIRPEVAQTAVQMGIDFQDVEVVSRLELC
ncbi:STAS domain-containing protein [Lederbergia panacisoli]|uniref:STAS domain-containing protein n=1 Tax=Lederbergia panacisoli TaxID=1255251 RepID=UPI00214C9E4C|nr:STAS domain-containing protein [Lederbergia panacisoli]MCR2822710.1 STAS domain-containing protein [Lederbergia panacisoli]